MDSAALWIGPAIVAAVIAGLINALGWFVTFRQARRLEQQRRSEKVTDIQSALLAEIRSDLQNLAMIDADRQVSALRERLSGSAALGSLYTPFVPRDSGAPIFSAIVGEISILPTAVIDPAVLYYKQKEAISHFTEDLRGDRFEKLPADRKLEMMEDYLGMKTYAAALARDAMFAFESSLGLSRPLSKTAQVPSDRISASGSAGAAGAAAGKSA